MQCGRPLTARAARWERKGGLDPAKSALLTGLGDHRLLFPELDFRLSGILLLSGFGLKFQTQ